MSQRLVTSNVNTNIPGAYPSVTVQSNPVGGGSSGIVAIIGEADGGASYQTTLLSANTYTPDQLDKVIQKYISGPIVDAMTALSAPSNDSDISGSANRVFIIKTNTGSKASALIDTNYGILQDLNLGKPGNKYKFQISSIAAEVAPTITGTTIPAFGAALNGMEFSIRQNGGAASTVILSATSTNHVDVPTLVVELNSLLPSGVVASAGTVVGTITLTMASDPAANRKGFGKSMELVEVVSGDLAALGLNAGLITTSQEPGVEVAISRPDKGVSETIDITAKVALSIGYAGTAASITVSKSAKTLTSTVTGGIGANLSIDMSTFTTVADLATYVNAQPGYSAVCAPAAQQSPTSSLDSVIAIGAASASAQPARIKSAANDFQIAMNTSIVLQFVATAQAGLPSVMASPAYLTGGARGATAAADIVAALQQLAGVQVNIIVPLFSQDAVADIAVGATDSGSTYTIAAVNAATKSHCIEYSSVKLKHNRIAILSMNAAYSVSKAEAQSLASYRQNMVFQRVTQVNSAGVITIFQPWYAACVAAGMQAGGFYKSITNKLANIISVIDPVGFDSGSPGDLEDALDAGLLILSQDTSGIKWVSDQTTYGLDTNFVYNSMQAVYCSDILSLDLASNFQNAFVGKSLADVSATVALSFLAQLMDGYKKLKLIASSDDAPLGFKNAKVTVSGPVVSISVEIKLATAIYFIPININISQVQQSA